MFLVHFISIVFFLLTSSDAPDKILSSRVVAAQALLSNYKPNSNAEFSLQRLESSEDYQNLAQRDRSFARALVTATERRLGQIEKIMEAVCRKKSSVSASTKNRSNGSTGSRRKKLDDKLVDAALKLGIAQILFLDVPEHAAVKETVDILRATPAIKVAEFKIKFVNAILRRVARDGNALLAEHTHLSDNIAPWLLEQWTNDWGTDCAVQISEAFMQQSPVHLSVKHPTIRTKVAREKVLQEVSNAFGSRTTILPNGSIRVSDDVGGRINQWPLYDDGIWWVQDVSATLPALSLFSAFDAQNLQSLHVVDMCAAPGGKTAQLVSLGFGQVTAVECSAKRTQRLKKNLERLGMTDKCTICIADGTEWVPPSEEKPVSGVLLDVPCSATGTASKRPDILRRSCDMNELLQIQESLANHCVDRILQPGGILVYATCSILKAESEVQVQKILSRETSGTTMVTVPFHIGEIPGFDDCIDENGWIRVLPGTLSSSIGLCDGFFVARLKRIF